MNNENLVVSHSRVVQRIFMLILLLLSLLVNMEAKQLRYSGSDRLPQSHKVDDRT
jgi:7,8-dihydro-6-hydroxymethylpterin-pyrophosphokinase